MSDYFATADIRTLMDQAAPTIDAYLSGAITSIDRHFGDGFAKANPALVGAFIQAAAQDFASSSLSKAMNGVAEQLEHIASAIVSLQNE